MDFDQWVKTAYPNQRAGCYRSITTIIHMMRHAWYASRGEEQNMNDLTDVTTVTGRNALKLLVAHLNELNPEDIIDVTYDRDVIEQDPEEDPEADNGWARYKGADSYSITINIKIGGKGDEQTADKKSQAPEGRTRGG